MNHELLDAQIRELNDTFGIVPKNICYLPESQKNFWMNISPEGLLPVEKLSEITGMLEEQSVVGDYLVVQGDFGSTFFVMDWAFKNGRIPLYATTRRKAEEKHLENSVEIRRFFAHDHFRKYEEYRGE